MNELAVIEQNAIVTAFQQPNGVDALFERIAEQARSFVPDVTTKKGRDAIGSLAAKVSSSKKLTEKYALELVAEQKAQIKLVDNDRITFCKKMDALRDEILAPRDAFIKAEEDRIKNHEAFVLSLIVMSAPEAYQHRDSTHIKSLISEIEKTEINDSLEEFKEKAELVKFKGLEDLRKALVAQEIREAEQAELERLRAEAAERERIEHEQRIAEQAAAKARAEAEAKAQAEREAAEQARINAEREQARLIAEAEAAKLREEAMQRKAVEGAKQAEIDKQAAIEAERLRIEREIEAKAQAVIAAEEARKANQEHMRKINQEALAALVAIVSKEQAQEVIKLIAKGLVPHICIQY